MTFVLDASVALTWCFEDEATSASYAILDRARKEYAAAPSLFPLEVANVLALAERRKRISGHDIAAYIFLLETLDLRLDESDSRRIFGDILDLARREGLTTYDATYLELALREDLPLATRDEGLRAAARRCGVEALPV